MIFDLIQSLDALPPTNDGKNGAIVSDINIKDKNRVFGLFNKSGNKFQYVRNSIDE
ncbi:MAG TPA: hypothetical protein VF242_12160 [Nitrososphaeraceae archaeon]